MSYTTIYAVPKQGQIQKAADYQNAFGGAWFVWNALYEAYEKREGEYLFQDEPMRRVWALFETDQIGVFERVVLGSTFDRVMVEREHWPRLAECMEIFYGKHYNGKAVCSLKAQAATLKELFEKAPDEIVAVCWRQTSVCGDAWRIFGESVDEYEDGNRDYDISKDTGHWFLFEKLEVPIQPQPEDR